MIEFTLRLLFCDHLLCDQGTFCIIIRLCFGLDIKLFTDNHKNPLLNVVLDTFCQSCTFVLQKKENCIRTIVKQIMNQPQENKIIMAGKRDYRRREKRVTSNRT